MSISASPQKPPSTGTYGGRKFISSPDIKKISIRPKSSPMRLMSAQQQESVHDRSVDTASIARPRTRQTNIDELERVLDLDIITMQNARRDINEAQKNELDKSMKLLTELKKESNALFASNEMKERELANLHIDIKCQEAKLASFISTDNNSRIKIKNFNEQHSRVLEKIAAEQRTRKMLNHIFNRNAKEIEQFRLDFQTLTANRESTEQEMRSVEEQNRLNRQDLLGEEKLLETLNRTRKVRTEERQLKIQQMKSIILDGELSVTRMNNSLYEQQQQQPGTSPVYKDYKNNQLALFDETKEILDDDDDIDENNSNNNNNNNFEADNNDNTMNHVFDKESNMDTTSHSRGGGGGGDGEGGGGLDRATSSAFFPPSNQASVTGFDYHSNYNNSSIAGSRNTSAHFSNTTLSEQPMKPLAIGDLALMTLSVAQIREIGDRYSSRNVRMERLSLIEADLKDRIVTERNRSIELMQMIERGNSKQNAIITSGRQYYQEFDMQEMALSTARRECEEAKEREYRLRVNIDNIRRAIARFLSKLTRTPQPEGSNDMISENIAKLHEELLRIIKGIGTAMINESAQNDTLDISPTVSGLNNASSSSPNNQTTSSSSNDQQQQHSFLKHHGGEGSSETAWLQKLPGYPRVKKQLFHNLMTAVPDMTSQNIRVDVARHELRNKGGGLQTSGAITSTGGGGEDYLYYGESSNDSQQRVHYQQQQQLQQSSQDMLDRTKDAADLSADSCLDRNVIKSISNLYIERGVSRVSSRSRNRKND